MLRAAVCFLTSGIRLLRLRLSPSPSPSPGAARPFWGVGPRSMPRRACRAQGAPIAEDGREHSRRLDTRDRWPHLVARDGAIPSGRPPGGSTPCRGLPSGRVPRGARLLFGPALRRRAGMQLVRFNAWTEIRGAPAWFLNYASRHLSIPLEPTPGGRPGDGRFGLVWWHEGAPWGSLVKGETVAAGLTAHVDALARYYGLPCEVRDARLRPEDQYPLHNVRASFRPYQDRVHERIVLEGCGVIDAPPRSGKTLMAARAIDALNLPTVYLAPSVQIVRQTYEVMCGHFGPDLVARIDGSAAPHEKDPEKQIVVSTPQSALSQPVEWWAARAVLIIDEFHHCLAPSQRVLTDTGESAISTIRVGDRVWSAGPRGLELRPVLNVWRRRAPATMLRIRTTAGTMEVTSEHRIYTPEGKIRAGALRAGGFVHVREVRKDDRAEGPVQRPCEGVQGAEADGSRVRSLWARASAAVARWARGAVFGQEPARRPRDACTGDGEAIAESGVPEAPFGAHDAPEPHATEGRSRSHDRGVQEGDRRGAGDSIRPRGRGQGACADEERAASGFGAIAARLRARVRRAHGPQARRWRDVVRDRLGRFGAQDRGRDRWERSPEPARAGRCEGRVAHRERLGGDPRACESGARSARVVTGPVLSVEAIAAPCSEVFDLEVEGNHNYFAEGVLVSNSASETYHRINELAAGTYYRLGFTGTHFRTGADGLAMEAVCSEVLHRVPLGDLVAGGYIARPDVTFLPVGGYVRARDWRQAYGVGVVRYDLRNEMIANLANRLVADGIPTIVITRRRAHADTLGEMIADSVVVKGGENALTSQAVRDFEAGKFACLVGTGVIGEGLDVPRAHALIYAAAGSDGVTLMQSYFRPLTKSPGKEIGRIYDFIDSQHPSLRRHSDRRFAMAAERLGGAGRIRIG